MLTLFFSQQTTVDKVIPVFPAKADHTKMHAPRGIYYEEYSMSGSDVCDE